jgi:Tol biopolymer transport system component
MRLCSSLLLIGSFGYAVCAAETIGLVTQGATNVSAAGNSVVSSMTPDGRLVVFSSHANNLVLDDDAKPYADVFVRDLNSGVVTLVTKAATGVGGGDGHSGYASISRVSRDGRYVVFASDAGNLVANDTNGVSDVFRRDLQTETTELVSVALSGGVAAASSFAARSGASRPMISPDGRYVAFESASMELVAEDTNATQKVFLRDLQSDITILASADARTCSFAALSTNAKHIAFIAANAGVITQANSSANILVRDLDAGTSHCANAGVASILQVSGTYRCLEPAIAPDGSFVVFKVISPGSPLAYVIHYNVGTAQTSLLASNSHSSTSLGLSADGQWLGFEESGSVYVRDLQHGTNWLVQ